MSIAVHGVVKQLLNTPVVLNNSFISDVAQLLCRRFNARLFAAISALPIPCTCTAAQVMCRILLSSSDGTRMIYRIVMELLGEASPDLLHKYEHAILNSYIEDNSNVRWCSSVPCCGRAVEALDDGYCEPKCECGHSFCFKCGSQPHSPATCGMWQQWEVKMCDDSETKNYLKVPHPSLCSACMLYALPCPFNSCVVLGASITGGVFLWSDAVRVCDIFPTPSPPSLEAPVEIPRTGHSRNEVVSLAYMVTA